MKIAVFHNLHAGGAKRALFGQVRSLRSLGHEIDVHVPSTADENYLPLRGFAREFHVYPLRRTLPGLVRSFVRYGLPPQFIIDDLQKTHERIAKAIDAGPCELVYCHHDKWIGTPFLARYVKKPVVYYCNEPLRFQERIQWEVGRSAPGPDRLPLYTRAWKANWMRRLPEIDRQNARWAKLILTNSYFTKESVMREFGIVPSVCYLGIDTRMFQAMELPRQNFLLSVGICDVQKGFDFILRALGLIDKRLRPKLMIVSNGGNPVWEAHVGHLAARLEVDLEVRKFASDEDLVILYNQARLFIYGAILEPFGLAPLEAMACGTPVVAVKEGGVRESVVDGQTGILTDRDEPAFANAVIQLLEDGGLRKKMSAAALETVRGFWTWEQAGGRLARHLDHFMNGRQGRTGA